MALLGMKLLIQYWEDFGRMGDLSALFITTKEDWDEAQGLSAYYSDILGKYSEVEVEIGDKCFEIKSQDQDFIAKLEELFPNGILSGFDPVSDALDQKGERNE